MRGEFWDRDDLVRRVIQAASVARQAAVAAVGAESSSDGTGVLGGSGLRGEGTRPEISPLVLRKVVAESAMLLRCAAPAASNDARLARCASELAEFLGPLARPDDLLAAMCQEPATALDRAAAHIHLSDLGFPDSAVDRFLSEVVDDPDIAGPERLPNHELERAWLRSIWSGDRDLIDAELVARSSLGRPLDVLGASATDLYAFTHAVLYATDMGRRPVEHSRPAGDLVVDVEAALAAAIDADNLDLTAELLWCWPMLRLEWTPPPGSRSAFLPPSKTRMASFRDRPSSRGPGNRRQTASVRNTWSGRRITQLWSWVPVCRSVESGDRATITDTRGLP